MEEQKRVKAVRREWWYYQKNVLLIKLVQENPVLYDFNSPQYGDISAKSVAWKDIGRYLNTSGSRCKTRWEQLRAQHRKKLGKSKSNGDKLRQWKYENYMSFLLPFMKERISFLCLDDSPDVSVEEIMTADHYDYEISIENIKFEECKDKEKRLFENGVHAKGEIETDQAIRSSTSTAETLSKQFPKHKKKHLPSKPSFLQQLPNKPTSETTPTTSTKLPQDENIDISCTPVYPTAPDPLDQFFSLMATTVKKFNALDQHFVKSKIFNLVSKIEEKYLYQEGQTPVHVVYSSSPMPSPYAEACNSQTSEMPSESVPTEFQEVSCFQLNE